MARGGAASHHQGGLEVGEYDAEGFEGSWEFIARYDEDRQLLRRSIKKIYLKFGVTGNT